MVSKQKGVQFYYPTQTEMQEWRSMAKQVWPQFVDKVPQQYIDRVMKAQE